MVRQKIVGARPDGRISAPARYALLRRSLRDVPQERVLRPAEGGGRIWNPPLHPAGAGTPRRPPRQRAAKRTGRKEEQTKSDRGPVHLPGAVMRRAAPSPAGAGTPRRPPRQRVAKRNAREQKYADSGYHPVRAPPHRMRRCSSSRDRSGAGSTGPSISAGPIRATPAYTNRRTGRSSCLSKRFSLPPGAAHSLLPRQKRMGGASPQGPCAPGGSGP